MSTMNPWLSLALVIAALGGGVPAMADVTSIGYQTDSHHVIVDITNHKGRVHKDGYTYRVWNKPNSPYEDDAPPPAWKIPKGTYVNLAKTCSGKEKYAFRFRKGATAIDVVTGDKSCFEGAPSDALGELVVRIKGKEKARYWLYEGD